MKQPVTPLGSAIRAANEERVKQENQNTSKPESRLGDKLVNLSIKVSKRQRVHWLVEAKRRDTSLTEAIVQALNARFGEPEH